MKYLVLLIALIFQVGSASADCVSRQEARQNYKGCLKFLEMPAKEQRRVAASIGATRRAGIKACEVVKRAGLKRVLANPGRYFCTSSSTGESEPDRPVCQYADDCKGGYCSASGRCMNGGSGALCDSSLQCGNGYCDLGGHCN